MRRSAWIAAVVVALSVPAAPALAHAERSASTPREGAALPAAPDALRITFTEPPTGDAVVQVTDGCGRDVVGSVEVQNYEITAALGAGQPGKWSVQTNVISVVDGHNTRDRWAFRVRGEPDCSAAETDVPEAGGDEGDDDGGSSSFPLLALGGATLVLVAAGVMLRNR